MTDDIVTRLRRHSHTEYPMGGGQVFRLKMPLLSEAADEIERLRKVIVAVAIEGNVSRQRTQTILDMTGCSSVLVVRHDED